MTVGSPFFRRIYPIPPIIRTNPASEPMDIPANWVLLRVFSCGGDGILDVICVGNEIGVVVDVVEVLVECSGSVMLIK